MLMLPLAQGLNQTANIIKGFAIAIGIAIAIGFIWMWWVHRVRERRQELAARARNVYSAYLRQSVHYPELAEPMLGAINTPVEMARYKQFVSGLLATADEVLLLDPAAAWRHTLGRQFHPHRSYLASEEFRKAGLEDCTAEVKALIQRVVAG